MLKALNKKNNFPIDPFNNVEIVAPSMNLNLKKLDFGLR